MRIYGEKTECESPKGPSGLLLVDGTFVVNGGYGLDRLPNGNLSLTTPSEGRQFEFMDLIAAPSGDDYNEILGKAREILAACPEGYTVAGWVRWSAEMKQRYGKEAELLKARLTGVSATENQPATSPPSPPES